jgi:transcriptional regulator with XRE-family HTH domain
MTDLQATLDRHNIRQKDLAFITGCTTRSVYNWLTGHRPRPRSAALLLQALDEGRIDEAWLASKLSNQV